MLSFFCATSLSIAVFFVLYRVQGIGDLLRKLSETLAPFIYGGVVAYLLRPMCNFYESVLQKGLPKGMKKASNTMAVALSMLSAILIVYALIIMIAPQLYESILSLWNSLPGKIDQFLTWAQATFGEDEELLQYFNSSYRVVLAELETWVQNTLVPYASNILSGVGSSVMKVLSFV